MTSALLPVFLKLNGRRALVVGGGAVGARKARELLEAGAHVVAVSLAFTDAFPAVAERRTRAFTRDDVFGAAIVFACTGVVHVDDAIARAADASGALVNVVDRPEVSRFYSAALVRRGPLVVAVGTSGASPTLARAVRDRIDALLPAGVGALAEALGRARPRLLARYPSMAERTRVLEAFIERAWRSLGAGAIDATVERELLESEAPCT